MIAAGAGRPAAAQRRGTHHDAVGVGAQRAEYTEVGRATELVGPALRVGGRPVQARHHSDTQDVGRRVGIEVERLDVQGWFGP